MSKIELQWGSEIWTSLDFNSSKRGWVANGPNLEWDLKSQRPTSSLINILLNPNLIIADCRALWGVGWPEVGANEFPFI